MDVFDLLVATVRRSRASTLDGQRCGGSASQLAMPYAAA
jgi:hypothetical protein